MPNKEKIQTQNRFYLSKKKNDNKFEFTIAPLVAPQIPQK